MPRPTLEERFRARVAVRADGCWEWTGAKYANGYGKLSDAGKYLYAHRVSYELDVGAIPEGLQLDHLCRNRKCVNPSHLEPVSRRTNILRGESISARSARSKTCIRGHPWTDENTSWRKDRGSETRMCRTCAREKQAKRRANETPEQRQKRLDYFKAWGLKHGRVRGSSASDESSAPRPAR